jgi:hypothetical protein
MPAILRHDRGDRGQFGHLVPERVGVVSGQRPPAPSAGVRLALPDVVGTLDQGPPVLRMAGLAAGLLPRGRLGRGPLDGRRVGGWRLGGVGRVLAESGFQLGDPGFELSDPPFDPPDVRDDGRGKTGEEFRRQSRRLHAETTIGPLSAVGYTDP